MELEISLAGSPVITLTKDNLGEDKLNNLAEKKMYHQLPVESDEVLLKALFAKSEQTSGSILEILIRSALEDNVSVNRKN